MEGNSVFMIEQNLLPFRFEIFEARTYHDTCVAIKNMTVRGAGAIGAAGAFAMAQAAMSEPEAIEKAKKEILATRPTAQNLFYMVDRVFQAAKRSATPGKAAAGEAQRLVDAEVEVSKRIGEIGSELIRDGMNIETHCNAGWLAFVDHGTALSPVYAANEQGKKIFIYVDETRPRGQGARLTAWELANAGVPHRIIADNAGAYLMSKGKVDMMIVGADRIARNGDVANKIGTLEKAVAAREFGVPFYVAAPTYTIDPGCRSGNDIPIEERGEEEVLYQSGLTADGRISEILVANPGSKAMNPAFDVTPAKYIAGIITEKGIVKADEKSISSLFGS